MLYEVITFSNSLFEQIEVSIVFRIQTFLLDKLPQPFNQVEIRRIGGQIEQVDFQQGGCGPDEPTFLITDIIKNQGDRPIGIQGT